MTFFRRRWTFILSLPILQAIVPLQSMAENAPTSPQSPRAAFCDTGPDALSFIPAPRTCIGVDDERRCWYTYTPPISMLRSRQSSNPDDSDIADPGVPLVLDLHGVLSCARRSAEYTGWRQLASEDGFVLVWPQGIEDSNIAFPVPCWNAGGCCCFRSVLGTVEDRVVDVPDVKFLRQVIADSVAASPVQIDTRRIYLAGHSNGCMMAQRLAVELSDIIAAVCCHSGVAMFDFDTFSSYAPTPVMIIHGEKDKTVPYEGGIVGSFIGSPSAEENIANWAAANKCSNGPTIDVSENFATHTYDSCISNATVVLIQMFNTGHNPYKDKAEFWDDNFYQTNIDTTKMAKEFCFEQRKEGEIALEPCTNCTPHPTYTPTMRPVDVTIGEPTSIPTEDAAIHNDSADTLGDELGPTDRLSVDSTSSGRRFSLTPLCIAIIAGLTASIMN